MFFGHHNKHTAYQGIIFGCYLDIYLNKNALKYSVVFETQLEYLCVSAVVGFLFIFLYPQASNLDICTVKFV